MRILTIAQNIRTNLLTLLYPQSCVHCGDSGDLFCSACRQKIAYVAPPLCPLCGYPSPDGCLCRRCRQSGLVLDGIRSVVFFEGPLRQAMHALKYRGLRSIAGPLADLMADYWRRTPLPADVIVPVPLHRQRLRERGYNQAAVLAQAFGHEISLPVRENWLVRTRATATQIDLDAAERKQNVAHAFQCRDDDSIAGRQVLLIDDVCTTGATLDACSQALQQAGAQSVWGFTLARAR